MVEQSSRQGEASPPYPDSDELAAIAARSQRIVSEFLSRQQGGAGMADPSKGGEAFYEMTRQMMADTGKMIQAQVNLWQDYMALWQNTSRRTRWIEGKQIVKEIYVPGRLVNFVVKPGG